MPLASHAPGCAARTVVLIATDGTWSGLPAVEAAVALYGPEVDYVMSIPVCASGGSPSVTGPFHPHRLLGVAGATLQIRFVSGELGPAACALADELDADAIAVGLDLGPVPVFAPLEAFVLARCRRPVLVIARS